VPKLLQINSCINWGSTGKIAEQIGDVAMQNGWESYVAYGRSMNPSKSELIKVGTKGEVILHGMKTMLYDGHGLGSKHATQQLVKRIQALNPDIIHLHNIHGYYINYPILFEYLNSIDTPIVWTLHDCWSFTGHCAHFVVSGCEKWKTMCENCELERAYPRSYFADNSKANFLLKKKLFAANPNMHIITVSEWLAGLARESFMKNADIRVINNGVDLDIFRPQELQKENGKFMILGVTNIWSSEKGLDDFVKLAKMIDKDKYEIVLIGLTHKQIDSLSGIVKGIRRTDSVEQLARYYSMADAFVNLTYSDSFPTTNLEAMACGTPVVTYRTGGSPEAVSDDTGFIVEQGDITEVARIIEGIADKGKNQYSRQCRARAEQFFDKDKNFEKYIDLYKQLITK
jgi:putative colanic acid biosynthesis glycosyltransferase